MENAINKRAICALFTKPTWISGTHPFAGEGYGDVAMQDLTLKSSSLTSEPVVSSALEAAAEGLLTQALGAMNLTEGEITMFPLDMPSLPSQHTAVMLVQTTTVQQVAASNDRTIGVCQLIGNPDPEDTAFNGISPVVSVRNYFNRYERRNLTGAAQVTILKDPEHGVLEDLGDGEYRYRPSSSGYLGNDNATLLVQIGGYKVKVVVAFHVLEGPLIGDTTDLYKALCPRMIRRISLDSSSDLGTTDLSAWQRNVSLSALIANANQSFAGFQDLAGSAVGTTAGEGANAAITLDTDAAGHGWYVDPTPLDNTDDYLPTSDPSIWQAKAGSDAAGKMDMLSVLLHEYGHALGLEHSADSGDFMTETLQAGQRKRPIADELQLMANLVAQRKAMQVI